MMRFSAKDRPVTHPVMISAAASLLVLSACSEPLDYDLRGNLGGFSTANAAQAATATRPAPDSRGVISYPSYQVAVARRGDTTASVAKRVGLDPEEVARFNGIGAEIVLRPGEIVALPKSVGTATDGVDIESLAGAAIDSAPATTPAAKPVETTLLKPVPKTVETGPEPVRHKVARGETAYTIARLYQVPVKSLAEWNGLGSDFAVREGQFLLIPIASQNAPSGATQAAAAATTTSQPGVGSPTPTPPSATTPLPDEKVAPASEVDKTVNSVGEPTKASTAIMSFPVKGKIIRTYSKGRNDGIDIAAAPGAPVVAADNGTVAGITEGADKIPIVLLSHSSNLLTVYANVDNITVAKGDTVKRGQTLARLRDGDDAYVHFEVRDGFDSVDPIPYLEE